jgi:regulator of sirC expression with transglutaminase-like and TPR domain
MSRRPRERETRRRFSALARAADPPFDSLLLALAEEFHEVDRTAVLEELDELARPLFGVGRYRPRAAGEAIAARLAEAVPFRPAAASVDDLFFDRVLRDRRGHPALLAAIYVELARRAGVSLCLFSSGEVWLAGIVCDDEAVLLDPARSGDALQAQLTLRRHCAHELAHGLLCSLTTRFRALGSADLARRAAELRLELPLGEEIH